MTVEKALEVFKKKYPDKTPIGYWEDGTKIILNTEPQYGRGFGEVCQYIVFMDGTVQGTNVMRSPVIGESQMIKL